MDMQDFDAMEMEISDVDDIKISDSGMHIVTH